LTADKGHYMFLIGNKMLIVVGERKLERFSSTFHPQKTKLDPVL
jgi:hypothetical protein